MARFANPFRHQLPVLSPVTAAALARGLSQGLGSPLPGVADPRSQLLDALIRAYRARDGVLLGSGTQALTLALAAARQMAGDPAAPVALPAYSCFDLVTAAVGSRSRVTFYDLDPASLAPETSSLEAALEAGARVVVLAPLFGIPMDRGALEPLLERWDAVVVDDVAQSHGARWQGEPVGAGSELAVLSFGRGKGWTGGGGGALLVGSDRASGSLHRVFEEGRPDRAGVGSSMRSWARAAAVWGVGRPDLYRIPRSVPALGLGETRYREPEPLREMSPGAAAILLATALRVEGEAEARRRHAGELLSLIEAAGVDPGIRGPVGGEAGYLRLPVRVRGGSVRVKRVRGAEARAGLAGTADPERARMLGAEGGYPRMLPELPQVADWLAEGRGAEAHRARWPGADALVQELVTLPTHSRTRRHERQELVSLLPAEGSDAGGSTSG
jgi:perosamine synthetase